MRSCVRTRGLPESRQRGQHSADTELPENAEVPAPVFIGSDDLIAQAFTYGAAGSISGNANVLPELFVQLYRAKKSGRGDVAQRCQELVDQLAEATHHGNIPLLKAGLARRGVPVGSALPPLTRPRLSRRQTSCRDGMQDPGRACPNAEFGGLSPAPAFRQDGLPEK